MVKRFVGSNQKTAYKIDSAEKAYTLGFLWGDGHMTSYKTKDGISDIHYPVLEITRIDLDLIKELFSVWGDWDATYRHRANRKPQGQIILCDKDFGWFLCQYDYLIKSITEPTKILSIIPNKLKSYWWRGLIDADGCFYTNKKEYLRQFSLASTFEQPWTEAEKLFTKLKIVKYDIQRRTVIKSKSSVIRISNRNDIIRLGDYIYAGDQSIGLQRKYEKFLEIKN